LVSTSAVLSWCNRRVRYSVPRRPLPILQLINFSAQRLSVSHDRNPSVAAKRAPSEFWDQDRAKSGCQDRRRRDDTAECDSDSGEFRARLVGFASRSGGFFGQPNAHLTSNYGALASAASANTQSNVVAIAIRGRFSASIDLA